MLYTPDAVRARLYALSEPDKAKFSAKLLPGTAPPLGVRLPALRAFAKEIAKSPDMSDFLAAPVGELFEERMLYGMVLGYAPLPLAQTLRLCAGFVPHIDNWSVCDSAVATFAFAKKHQAEVFAFLRPYLASEREFEARFGIVMLLLHFVNEAYVEQVLDAVCALRADGYYAEMAAAWAVCECYIKFPAQTRPLLLDSGLCTFVHNKAIQKICESYRVSDADKALLRAHKKTTAGKRAAAKPGVGEQA